MHYAGDRVEAAMVARTLAGKFRRLRFPAPLEQAFLADGAACRLRLMRHGGLGSIALFVGMLIADAFMIPDRLALAVTLRAGLYAPAVLAGLYLVHRVSAPRLTEWLAAGAGALAGGISMVLSLSSDSVHAAHHLVILNVVVVYAALIGRFWPMLSMCLAMALGYAVSLSLIAEPLDPLGVAMTLLLLSTMVFAMYGNYLLEHSDRQVYLVDHQEVSLGEELAKANEALTDVVRTDPLTGLANRRAFDEFVRESWDHARQRGSDLSVMLLDIDHFKRFNDHYGHPAGDVCLCEVGQLLRSHVRPASDLVARWGGEEFAVVMNGLAPAAARAACDRLLEAVRDANIAHDASPLAARLTVSIGLATARPGDGLELDEWMSMADQALYAAKHSGRDQVAVAPMHAPLRLREA